MSPSEFNTVALGYIDRENDEETIVNVPEQPDQTLISEVFEPAGFVYAIGRSVKDQIGVYRLENSALSGSGKDRVDVSETGCKGTDKTFGQDLCYFACSFSLCCSFVVLSKTIIESRYHRFAGPFGISGFVNLCIYSAKASRKSEADKKSGWIY